MPFFVRIAFFRSNVASKKNQRGCFVMMMIEYQNVITKTSIPVINIFSVQYDDTKRVSDWKPRALNKLAEPRRGSAESQTDFTVLSCDK